MHALAKLPEFSAFACSLIMFHFYIKNVCHRVPSTESSFSSCYGVFFLGFYFHCALVCSVSLL